MNFYVDKIQKFFQSIAKYFSNTGYAFSWLFIIFVGAFALTTLVIIVSSSYTYECVLTRAIDKINKFLEKNPRINDDNLITFNNKMKERGIPKVLRRQWQQFMLYREHEASYYMSFKHCVENPLKNSTYSQQMGVYKAFSLIFVFLSALVGVFTSYENSFRAILQDVLIIPIIILVVYWLVSMILNLIHNATTADLYQNYQYFEINMDKATMTLPEYVDYEVLFTQSEIKKGIPVLFEYIQKRAMEEQQELEKARIKNVEHEKFNFDESGIDASLVLERSMNEAENYIATRKKFMQDIEQVNTEISQLENQYRENVKENQRLMQTSKESLDGLKQQLEQASSSIETNYIKKQMKDEVNRQQVAERDFDAMTDKYNQEQKNLQAEVNRLQGEIDKAKKDLESNMMSEFSTYSNKVYKKLEEVVGDDQKEIINGYKKQINELEEKLSMKDQELDNVYSQYQNQVQEMEEKNKAFDNILREKDDFISSVQEQLEEGKTTKPKGKKFKKNEKTVEEPIYDEVVGEQTGAFCDSEDVDFTQAGAVDDENFDLNDDFSDDNYDANQEFDAGLNGDNENQVFDESGDNDFDSQDGMGFDYLGNDNGYIDEDAQSDEDYDYEVDDNAEEKHENQEFDYTSNGQDEQENSGFKFNYLANQENPADEEPESDDNGMSFNYLSSDEESNNVKTDKDKVEEKSIETDDANDDGGDIDDMFNQWLDEDKEDDAKSANESNTGDDEEEESAFDSWLNDEEDSEEQNDTEESEEDEEADEENVEEESDEDDEEDFDDEDYDDESDEEDDFDEEDDDEGENVVDNSLKVKRGPGRPRKEVEEEPKEKRGPGRPRKVVEEPVRRVGRPKKVVEEPVRRVGRPRKEVEEAPKRPVGRPAKNDSTKRSSRGPGRPRKVGRPKGSKTTTRAVGRPKKANPVGRPKKANPVGRPRKSASYTNNLNEIDRKLKELNEQIKRENQNLAKTKKQLEKASLKKGKK